MNPQATSALSLIGLLSIFTLENADEIRQRTIDTVAENFGADLVGIVVEGEIIRATGVGDSTELEQYVTEAEHCPHSLSLVSDGQVAGGFYTLSLPIERHLEDRFVISRRSGAFEADELRTCRAIVRMMRHAIATVEALNSQRTTTALLATEVSHNKRLANELSERHFELMTRMRDLQAALSSSPGSVLSGITNQGSSLFDGDDLSFLLLDTINAPEFQQPEGGSPLDEAQTTAFPSPQVQLSNQAIARNELVAVSWADNPVIKDHHKPFTYFSGISAPVHQRHLVAGSITVSSNDPTRIYSEAECEALLLLAGYASVALGDAAIIEERQNALEQAEWQATHCPLSGLANRRLVIDTIGAALDTGVAVTVLYLDVDRFKSINDLHGHQVGDDFIVAFATRLAELSRPTDLVGRLAGDEFVVVTTGEDDTSSALGLAERLLDELAVPFDLAGRSIRSSVSIGLATSEGITTAGELINAADVAMYQAKSSGRNLIGLFDEDLHQQIHRKAVMAERLKNAVSYSLFELVYQPIVDIGSGVVQGYEALVRMDDPIIGLVEPEEFLALAEELGLAASVDDWVIDHGIRQIVESGTLTHLSINVSPAWLASPKSYALVIEAADCHQFPLDHLSLELTERVPLSHEAVTTLNELQRHGVQVILDDFGTNDSSLSSIREFEIDGIKIDPGFLLDADSNRQSTAILEAILTLADRLDASAIAKGVETEAQVDLLASLGCTKAQGYYYGLPAPGPAGLQPHLRA